MELLKKYSNLITIAALLIMALLLVRSCNNNSDLKTKLNISKQNAAALADTVRITKNKAGQAEYAKKVLIAEKGNLENLNKDLYDEWKKEKGRVSELSKYVIVLKNRPKDTLKIQNTLIAYPDGSKGLKWEHDTIYNNGNGRTLAGVSKFKIDTTSLKIIPLSTMITKDELQITIFQGLRELNGNVEMFVRSDYPGFELKDMNSVIISPETHPVLKKFSTQRKMGIGIYGGYGIYYDNFNRTAGFGAQIGIGAHYTLFKL